MGLPSAQMGRVRSLASPRMASSHDPPVSTQQGEPGSFPRLPRPGLPSSSAHSTATGSCWQVKHRGLACSRSVLQQGAWLGTQQLCTPAAAASSRKPVAKQGTFCLCLEHGPLSQLSALTFCQGAVGTSAPWMSSSWRSSSRTESQYSSSGIAFANTYSPKMRCPVCQGSMIDGPWIVLTIKQFLHTNCIMNPSPCTIWGPLMSSRSEIP